MRWAAAGVLLGSLVAGLVFAPASWLASALSGASGQRLLLADARGTVWQGSAVMVLTGGEGSHDASALPGRLHWTLGLDGLAWRCARATPAASTVNCDCAWCPAWPACAWTCLLCRAPSGNGPRPGWWAWAHPGTHAAFGLAATVQQRPQRGKCAGPLALQRPGRAGVGQHGFALVHAARAGQLPLQLLGARPVARPRRLNSPPPAAPCSSGAAASGRLPNCASAARPVPPRALKLRSTTC
jgi:hypothetical protein